MVFLIVVAVCSTALDFHRQCFLLLTDHLIQGLHHVAEVVRMVAVDKFLGGIGTNGLSFLVAPCEILQGNVVRPHVHIARIQNQRQPAVAETQLCVHASQLDTIVDKIEYQQQGQQYQTDGRVLHPHGSLGYVTFRIEPLVLQVLQLLVGTQQHIDAVQHLYQPAVVRHELVLSVRHVHWRYLQIVYLELAKQPFQGDGIPDDAPFLRLTQFHDGFVNVVANDGIGPPPVVFHQVMTQTVAEYPDLMRTQVAESPYLHGLALRGDYALGKEGYGATAILHLLVNVAGTQSHHQVSLSVLQVGQRFRAVSHAYLVGDFQFLQHQAYQVNAEAVRLPLLIQIRVWPQGLPCVEDQRMLHRIPQGCPPSGPHGLRKGKKYETYYSGCVVI